jgi:hypothetical protein
MVAEANKVVAGMHRKFPDSKLSGWKKLEKELRLCQCFRPATYQGEYPR